MSNSLPEITHLQFLVLETIAGDECAGRDVRAVLADHGVRSSAPAFYQMMARLEEGRLVEGWYDQKLVAGQNVKERRYRLTKNGRRAFEETRNFYLQRAAASRPVRRGSHV